MKKLLFLSIMLFSVLIFGQSKVSNLVDFSTLKVSNGIQVEIIKSDQQKIEISGEKSHKVQIKNENNLLIISLIFPERYADNKVNIKIYYNKSITLIEATDDKSTVNAADIKQDNLEVVAKENAFINLSANVKNLKVNAGSGGVIKIIGSTADQEVTADLYGVYNGFQMVSSESTTVYAGTGAKAELFPGKKLTAKVDFGGSVFYKGETELIKDGKAAGGIIKKRN